MILERGDWTAVVVGSWNRAILTPAMVARKLFRLADETPVQVAVQLDVFAPYQICHDEIVVVPFRDKLIVATKKPTFESLERALKVAVSALDELPRTPLTAAGFNLRFKSGGPTEALRPITNNDLWDNRISDDQFEVDERSVVRAIKWRDGKIRVTVTEHANSAHSVLLNFDLQTDSFERLRNWMSADVKLIEAVTGRVLKTIGLSPEEFASV